MVTETKTATPANAKPTRAAKGRTRPAERVATKLNRALGWTAIVKPERLLKGLSGIAESEAVHPEVRVKAYTEIRNMMTCGILPNPPVTMVREMTGDDEQDVATIAISALQASATGRLPPHNGKDLIEMANRAMDTVGLAKLIRDQGPLSVKAIATQVLGTEPALPAPKDPPPVDSLPTAVAKALSHPKRPVWRKEGV